MNKFSAVLSSALFVAAGVHAEASLEERVKTIEEQLKGHSGAASRISAFNPGIGVSIDSFLRQSKARGNFQFRSAELNVGADIDPFVKGWAIINATPAEVAIEEAAVRTTALPYNLTVTAGRQFASFGRLAHFHTHELPVPERPLSLDTYIGGETQADGVEVTQLVPIPFYLAATFGVFNRIGGENARVNNAAERTKDEFTYLARLNTSAELADDHGIELGAHSAWTPKRTVLDLSLDTNADGTPDTPAGIITRKNTWRTLQGADLTYRYQPAEGGIYRGFLWSTELMQNNERRFDPATRLPADRVSAWGGFSYVQAKLGRHWRPGLMVDLMQALDNKRQVTRTYTAFATYDVTAYNKLRLAYSYINDNNVDTLDNQVLGLQWSVIMGYHVHAFRDR